MVKKPLRAVRLAPSDPHSALRRPARVMPARRAEPLRLTPEQLKNPLIRTAKERLGNIERYRGKYLRRLDSVNGDRRTRVEVFRAIERVTEPMLVRFDMATGVLGYLDEKNVEFVLNTQLGIAEDSLISPSVLNRMFKTLDAAGYVYRRIERIRLDEKDENGLHLVRTRMPAQVVPTARRGIEYSRPCNSLSKRPWAINRPALPFGHPTGAKTRINRPRTASRPAPQPGACARGSGVKVKERLEACNQREGGPGPVITFRTA